MTISKLKNSLNTKINLVKNVENYIFGKGTISKLKQIIENKTKNKDRNVVFFIDIFFKSNGLPINFDAIKENDLVFYVDTSEEPTTSIINQYTDEIKSYFDHETSLIVGLGGGCTMDTAKAVSNLLNNQGRAEDFQGWDLIKEPGVYKIGIPTISGTGAETTRTCVMINPENGLKLGMNSEHSVFNQIILDHDLTATVPKNQFFWTGMDAYIHCIESLAGNYRNAIGDSYSEQSMKLCKDVFNSNEMMSDLNRQKLMVASYLGGSAIAMSYVGLIHPLSASLTVALGIHHCLANCIVMRGIQEYYPFEYEEFWSMAQKQNINIPEGVCKDFNEKQYEELYSLTLMHEKPLLNALGDEYKKKLTLEKVVKIFEKM